MPHSGRNIHCWQTFILKFTLGLQFFLFSLYIQLFNTWIQSCRWMRVWLPSFIKFDTIGISWLYKNGRFPLVKPEFHCPYNSKLWPIPLQILADLHFLLRNSCWGSTLMWQISNFLLPISIKKHRSASGGTIATRHNAYTICCNLGYGRENGQLSRYGEDWKKKLTLIYRRRLYMNLFYLNTSNS